MSCQGGDYTLDVHPKLRAAGWGGYWVDAASTLRMEPDAMIVLDPVNGTAIAEALAAGQIRDLVCLGVQSMMPPTTTLDKLLAKCSQTGLRTNSGRWELHCEPDADGARYPPWLGISPEPEPEEKPRG